MLQYETVEPATLELLKKLMSQPFLNKFCLVGGTAIALQLGHRISADLDMFTLEDFDSDKLLIRLRNHFKYIEPKVKTTNSLILTLENIKTDFIKFHYPFSYPFVVYDNIRLLNLKDIAPMKLDAITGRGKKKDFYDLYFLLQQFTLPGMLKLYREKYHHATIFHVIKSLTWFADAEKDPEPMVLDKKLDWNIVKYAIVSAVNKL